MNTNLSALTEAIGWTLLHSLWQATAIAFLLLLFVKLARRAKPAWHYTAGCLAIGAILASSISTFVMHFDAPASDPPVVEYPIAEPFRSETPEAPISVNTPSSPSTASARTQVSAAPAPAVEVPENSRPWLPWLVAAWALGVCLLSIRFLFNWNSVLTLRRGGELLADHALLARFGILATQLKISRPVRFLISSHARVPMVIGWLKPAILLPAGLLSGLDTRQIEAIVAHELAHIRRYDYLVNLLQNLVETVFFFHPAVWWTSAQIRRDRENCCDDVAAALSGGSLHYARALVALEAQLCASVQTLGPAANGGNLLSRIRRLAGSPEPQRSIVPAALASFAVVALAAIVSLAILPHPAEGTGTPDAPPEDTKEESGALSLLEIAKFSPASKELPWGNKNPAGLAALIDLRARPSYPVDAALERSYLIGNFGKETYNFVVPHHVQDEDVDFTVTDVRGNIVTGFGTIIDDGAVALLRVTLDPGEYVRIPSSNLYLSKMPAGEGESPAGTYLHAITTTVIEGDTETEIAIGGEYKLSATIDLPETGELETGELHISIAREHPANRTARFTGVISSTETRGKVIALTFEDGPHAKNTPALLDFLKERGVKATFFLVGRSVERHPEIVRRMVAEGHEIGNHTMTHQNLKKMENAQILQELRDCHSAIVNACGVAPRMARAPYGAITPQQCSLIEREFGYNVIGWSIDPEDWKRPGVDIVASRLINRARPGAITILHDIHAPTVLAAKKAVDGLIEKGYEFVTTTELVGAAPEPDADADAEPDPAPAPKPIKVKGVVVDAKDGKPITKFTIQAGKISDDGAGDITWGFSQSGQTSEDGSFTTTLRLHEGWTGRIIADGFEPMPILAMAPPVGKESIEVTLRLKRGRIIHGVVLGHEGKPLAGAGVFRIGPTGLRLRAGSAWKSFGDDEVDDSANPSVTDAKGRFELSTGGVDRIAVSDVSLDAWPFSIPEDPGEKIVIRLPEPATMTIEYDIDGAVEEDEIFFQTLRFREPLWKGLEVTAQQPIKNGGKLVMKGLVPGPYQFARNKTIRLGGMGIGAFIGRTFVDLKPGEQRTLKFVRPKGARLAGEVELPEGVKLYGTLIKVKSAKKMIDPTDGKERDVEVAGVALKPDGTYLTERIAPGKYILTAEAYVEPDPADRLRTGRMGPGYSAQVEVEVPEGGGPVNLGALVLKKR